MNLDQIIAEKEKELSELIMKRNAERRRYIAPLLIAQGPTEGNSFVGEGGAQFNVMIFKPEGYRVSQSDRLRVIDFMVPRLTEYQIHVKRDQEEMTSKIVRLWLQVYTNDPAIGIPMQLLQKGFPLFVYPIYQG